MLRRRSGLSVAFTVLLGLALAAPVAADTSSPPDGNQHQADASAFWQDGDLSYTARARFVDDHFNGSTYLFVSIISAEPLTCDNGTPEDLTDDFAGSNLIEFYGEDFAPSIAIDGKLGSAIGGGTAAGRTQQYNECTGSSSSFEASHTVTLDMFATSRTTRSRGRSVAENPDGTRTISTMTMTSRVAGGIMVVDDVTRTVGDGLISLTVWSTVTR
jgi:hypothetical protein